MESVSGIPDRDAAAEHGPPEWVADDSELVARVCTSLRSRGLLRAPEVGPPGPAELERLEGEALFRQVAEHAEQVVWMLAPDGEEVLYVSPAFEKVWGRPRRALYLDPRSWMADVHPLDVGRVQAAIGRASAGNEIELEYRIRRPGGEVAWIQDRRFPVWGDGGRVLRLLGYARDITRTKAREGELIAHKHQLESQANHDPLTGLLNRRGLEKALQGRAEEARTVHDAGAAVLVDCDDFKAINDLQGITAGDHVLAELARRMHASVRPGDVVGRVGGDEFVVLLPRAGTGDALAVAERLRAAIAELPVRVGRVPVAVTASLGVVTVAWLGSSLEGILRRAHAALAESKRGGKNRVVGPLGRQRAPRSVSTRGLHARSWTLHDLATGAIERRDVVDLPARALAGRSVAPWLRAVERASSGRAILVRLRGAGPAATSSELAARLAPLRERGARLALEVGAGQSSFEALVHVGPDLIEVAPPWTRAAAGGEASRTALARLVRLAGALDAELVASGIATEDQRSTLAALGIQRGTGPLFEGKLPFA